MENNLIATASVSINAPASKVWEALTQPALIKQYLFGTEVSTDWKVGSPITYKGVWQGKPYEDKGKLLQVEPGKRIVSTYWSPLGGLPDRPEFYKTVQYILDAENGGTRVTVTQDNNATEDDVKHSEQNWQTVLKGLKTLLEGQYAQVNGLNMYYEIHGTTQANPPLIFLHGGLGQNGMFGANIPLLVKDRQVITPDLQAHGRTADIDRPLSLQAMADDVAALVAQLGLKSVDVMGYSMGGGVALQTAIRHPEIVRKLVVVSFPYRRDGWLPDVLSGMDQVGPQAAEQMKPSPIYQAYAANAPRPQDWPVLLTKMGDMLRKDYDWTEDVAALRMPVMLVAGDADSVRTMHTVQFFELLGGGKVDGGWDRSGVSKNRLAILPGVTHYEIFASPALAANVISFLNEPV